MCENCLLMNDFNLVILNLCKKTMSSFKKLYEVKNLVREHSCYKNAENPYCIDLFLTNKNFCFQDTNVFETGFCNSHKLVVTVMKTF